MFHLLLSISLVLIVSQNAADDVTTNVIKEGDCPFMCACSGNTVRCSRMTIFPEDLPKETMEFYISNSSVPFVPLNVFLNLPRLERISMASTTIDTVRACSFAELENVTEISFKNVMIMVIEGNAFSNLHNITHLTFEDSGIREMKSYSFHGMSQVASLRFSKTNISVVHPYSFLKVDSTELSIENSHIIRLLRKGFSKFSDSSKLVIKDTAIDQWQCESLDTFSQDGNVTRVSVTQSVLGCSCSLAWLWSNYPDGPVISEESNRCKISGSRLSTLTIDDVCPDAASRGRGCPPLLPSTPHSCSRKFDTPYQPEDKVDYPKYFTRTPANSGAAWNLKRVQFMQQWIVASLLLVMVCR